MLNVGRSGTMWLICCIMLLSFDTVTFVFDTAEMRFIQIKVFVAIKTTFRDTLGLICIVRATGISQVQWLCITRISCGWGLVLTYTTLPGKKTSITRWFDAPRRRKSGRKRSSNRHQNLDIDSTSTCNVSPSILEWNIVGPNTYCYDVVYNLMRAEQLLTSRRQSLSPLEV